MLGDPVDLVDPSGEFWQYIIGALALYLTYDTISDWHGYVSSSSKNINNSTEIRTPEDYINYRNRVNDQLENSRNIGKETTNDLLKAGYPFSKSLDVIEGAVYEFCK